MRQKTILATLGAILAIILVASSCTATKTPTTQTITGQITSITTTNSVTTTAVQTTTAVTTAVTTSNLVKDPATGKMVEKPRPGGTITYSAAADVVYLDPWNGSMGVSIISYPLEKLAMVNWAIDRNVFQIAGTSYIPLDTYEGVLAKSWETPDPTTFIIHLRQGVHWQNIAPMNGRELVADDVVYSYDRSLGLGDGFTTPSGAAGGLRGIPFKSITATDKYTVEVKLTTPNLTALETFLCESYEGSWVEPPEVIKQYGNLNDWHHVIGTGPFIISDHVQDSSWTFTKNTDYWGYDEKFPDNKLPYADLVRILVIPDFSTRVAALRAGKIDVLSVPTAQAKTLMTTNPELKVISIPGASGLIPMVTTKPPFNDIRVRQAMQKALDLPNILKTFYLGYGDATPFGQLGPATIGYYSPYSEWPDDVKAGYTYDVAGAKKLLADAGYPNGIDVTWDVCYGFTAITGDPDLAVLLKDYWSKAGIRVTLKTIDISAYIGEIYAKNTAAMGTWWGAWNYSPTITMKTMYYSPSTWAPFTNDPTYDAMVAKIDTAADLTQLKADIKACDVYSIKQQWSITLPRPATFTFFQPWYKGSDGEGTFGGGQFAAISARVWVDQTLKK